MPNSPKTEDQPYHIHNWGDGYFRYNQTGNIEVVNHATMQAVALDLFRNYIIPAPCYKLQQLN